MSDLETSQSPDLPAARTTPGPLRWLRRAAIALVVIYCVVVGLLVIFEEMLIFPTFTATDVLPIPSDLAAEDVFFTTKDGTKLHGWYIEPPEPRGYLLYMHGNGGNLMLREETYRNLVDRYHLAIFAFDYRGYGRSEGKPTEAGVLEDAEAAYDWLLKRSGQKDGELILMGESLGGAVAVDLAAKHGAKALIIEKTFSSLPEVAATHYPWVPVKLLMHTKLDSANKIGKYKGPLLQIHGSADTLVPLELGQKLYAKANEPKEFITVPGIDHNDPFPDSYYDELDRFLKKHGI